MTSWANNQIQNPSPPPLNQCQLITGASLDAADLPSDSVLDISVQCNDETPALQNQVGQGECAPDQAP